MSCVQKPALIAAIAAGFVLAATLVSGQTVNTTDSPDPTDKAHSLTEAEDKKWSFSASVYTYILLDDEDIPRRPPGGAST